jgi:AcrR family transcriptional regulator
MKETDQRFSNVADKPTSRLESLAMTDGRIERGRATRERLILTAREAFGRDGYEATSVAAILATAGVARGSLYHHFATKEALFDAVLDRVMGELAATVRDAARAQPDPVEAVRVGCVTWLRASTDPAIQRIALLDAPAIVGWERWRELDERHTMGDTKAVLHLLADAGRVPATDADLLGHMLLAAVGEAALLIARSDDPAAALTQAEGAVETLLSRLLAVV